MMFLPGSRYEKTGTVTVQKADGDHVTAVKIPLRQSRALLGFHRRTDGQRLDLIASLYLQDATAFWQLCDANNSIVPDALATRELVGIPAKGR